MHLLWLEDDVAAQLDLANAWLTRTNGTTEEAWAGIYEWTGSCVRILADVSGHRLLRVWQGDSLTLTDGAVFIGASLSPDCLQLTHSLSPGCLLAVRKFTIRYTPYGPLRERLNLALDIAHLYYDNPSLDFQSTTEDPKPIHNSENIANALRDLRRTLVDFDCSTFGMVQDESGEQDSMTTQEENIHGKPSPNTQYAFGTQIAHRPRSPVREPRENGNENGSDLDKQKTAALLGLIRFNGASGAHIRRPPIEPKAMCRDPPESASSNQANKAPSAGGFTRISTSLTSDEHVARPETIFQPTCMPPPYMKNDPSQNLPSTGKSFEKLFNDTEAAALGGTSQSQSDEDALEDTVPNWLDDTCHADGCGKVFGAQSKLLSHWQKPRADTSDRFPDANVPIGVLKALKQFKRNATPGHKSSDEEDSSASDTNPPVGDDGSVSDYEDAVSAVSWSSSAPRESPERRFRPDPALPPDSSLPSIGAGSQGGMQDSSSGQEAQRVVAIQSSNEEPTMDPRSSPPFSSNPQIPRVASDDVDDDDLDMDLELDVPRGLGEGLFNRYAAPSSAHVQRAVVNVQVEETPYAKEKTAASTSIINPMAHVQQQSSSGASKETSSTTIVYSTYKETPPQKDDAKKGVSELVELPSLPAGHKEVHESEDDRPLYSANDTPARHSVCDDVLMEDVQEEALYSPGPSNISRERERRNDDVVPLKRKIELSPLKNGRRPSKLIKIMSFKAESPSPPIKDSGEELQREKEEHWRKFTEGQRAQSSISNVAGDDATPGAQSGSIRREDSGEKEHDPASVHIHSGQDKVARSVPQMNEQTNERAAQSIKSIERTIQSGIIAQNDLKNFNKAYSVGDTVAPGAHEDVDMGTGEADVYRSDIGFTNVDDTLVHADAENVVVEETVLQGNEVSKIETGNNLVDDVCTGYVESGQIVSGHVQTVPARTSRVPSAPTAVTMAPKKSNGATQSPTPGTVFENFRRTYPAYTGDTRHFLGQCKTMDKLDQQDKMVPKWQWDDFIIRNRTDYRDYVNQCLDHGEDVEPYYRFYKDNIRDTLYTKGVVGNRKTLLAAIEELEGKIVGKPYVPDVPTSEFAATADPLADSPVPDIPSPPKFKAPATKNSRPEFTASTASSGRAAATRLAAMERPSPSPSVQKKRQSLPSAFNKRTERTKSAVPSSSNEGARESLPTSSSRRLSSLGLSSSTNRPTPVNQPSRLSASRNVSTRPPSLQRLSSGPRIPTEPTGDPYRDFIFAQNRVTSLTGSASIDANPDMKWPENLHVRPKAEIMRKGYDVLSWKDDL
ncbi:hypothetical protein BU23DRAFT_116305 [Bimuria novae-zelandiae CBS 107.79]|uniref:Uncharacterized protein n=1 Tax=Bimuria novae-zelandiae CBS 107.79 TaxID=1447943 RepID=A0A6A5VH70_9PLEO|nr:hypothetical protein BU23DRAFT_116305 [Bimuria novae-zelandiae CBS 107.79]